MAENLRDLRPVMVYKCNGCKMTLTTDAQYQYHKMFHLGRVRNSSCNIDIINFSLQENETRFIHCLACDIILGDEEEMEKHLNDVNHCKWINFLQSLKPVSFNDYLTGHSVKLDINYDSSLKIPRFDKISYCQICELSMKYSKNPNAFSSHLYGKKHLENLKSRVIEGKKIESSLISDNCISLYVCFICQIQFLNKESLYIHYGEEIHQFYAKVLYALISNNHVKIYQTTKDDLRIKCIICNIETSDAQIMLPHIFGFQHSKEIKTDTCLPVKVVNDSLNINPEPTKSFLTSSLKLNHKCLFLCPICENSTSDDSSFVSHLKTKKHKRNIDQYYKANQASLLPILKFSCPVCEEDFVSDRKLLEHITGSGHKYKSNITKGRSKARHISTQASTENIKKFTDSIENNNKNKIIQTRLSVLADRLYSTCSQFSQNNLSFDNIKTIYYSEDESNLGINKPALDKLTDSKLQENEENFLRILRNKRKLQQSCSSKNSSSQSLLATIGKEYIELCIQSGTKNIYNIDASIMYKIHLGITLSISTSPDVRCCIPCKKKVSSNILAYYEHLRDEEHMRIVLEITNDNSNTANQGLCMNDFKLACSYMKKTSKNMIRCLACSVKIENSQTAIKQHTNSTTHANNRLVEQTTSEIISQELEKILRAIWYFPVTFLCELCSSTFKAEVNFVRHLKQCNHIAKANEASDNGEVYEFDVCSLCEICWYATRDYYALHCNESSHKKLLKSQKYKIPELMDTVEQILNHYEGTIVSLLRESDETDSIIEKDVLKRLEMVVRYKYPGAKAYLYGSRLSRTSFAHSDLDIYLDCEGTYYNVKSTEESQKKLFDLQRCLKKHKSAWIIKEAWTIDDVLLSEREPAIQLLHISTNLNCNVHCMGGLEVEKSKLIWYFADVYPTCRELILFLKKWLFHCGLLEITDYAASILVIFYLQIENILPSLSSLIKQPNNAKIVAGWKTSSFTTKIDVKVGKHTIKDHLSQLFDYYANFNYMTDVICPFLGRAVAKENFVDFASLPEEMIIYKCNRIREGVKIFYFASPMCTQDPIELPKNLTQIISKRQLRVFRQYCAESKMILDEV